MLKTQYPLNDGGLFYQFILDIQAAHYRLPFFTTYNAIDQIPFAYPPLAFYFTAALNDLLKLDLLFLLRWLPLLFNLLTFIPAYHLICRFLPEKNQRIYAWLAYCMLLPGYYWFIMGGGLTRSLGTFFGFSAMVLFYDGLRKGGLKRFIYSGILLGFTALTHIEITFFTVLVTLLMAVIFGGIRIKISGLLIAGGLTLIIAGPFYVTIVIRHGLDVFMAALSSGTLSNLDWVFRLLRPAIAEEAFMHLFEVLFFLGMLVSLARRQYFLAAWMVVLFVFGQRSLSRSAILPVSILAAIGLDEIVIKGLRMAAYNLSENIRDRLIGLPISFLVPLLFFAQVFISQLAYPLAVGFIDSIDSCAVDAMQWIKTKTSQNSLVLALPDDHPWYLDPVNEWLPALSKRYSYLTVQGYEWKKGEFKVRMERYEELQNCIQGSENSHCLEDWMTTHENEFDYLLIPKPSDSVIILDTDQYEWLQNRYLIAYENEGFWIHEVP